MVLLNKILNVLIFLVAIVACVAAVLLHERRIELRTRADIMADVLAKTASITDGSGETSSELNASANVNENSLDWESFHKARDEQGKFDTWITNVRTIEDKLRALHTMKTDLADVLIKTAENLEYEQPEGLRASMNSALTYDEFSKKIHDQSAVIRKRDDRLATALVEVSMAIKKVQNEAEFKVLADEERLNSSVKKLIGEAGNLYSRSKLLAHGLADLQKAFTADPDGEVLFSPSWNSEAFNTESPEKITDAFVKITRDLKTLNDELYKLKVARKTIDNQAVQLTRQNLTIEELNIENDFLKNKNGSLKAQIVNLERKLASVLPKEKNPVRVSGTVVDADDRYNFIVINRGKDHGLVLGALMLVHKDGKFICKVKTSRVLDDQAVCEILPSSYASTTDSGLVPEPGAQVVTVSN